MREHAYIIRPTPLPLPNGARLGPYEVLAKLGEGGMGEVYQARDTKLGRDVALKILPDGFAHDPDRLARFGREAQVLASLNHPNIAGIYGLEDSGDTKALVLEFVDGPTLADRIAQGPLPAEESLQIAKQIGEALEAAHNAGIVHRDLKPANIKLTPGGAVKVLDFGLAKAIDSGPAIGSSSSLSLSPTITTPAMTQIGFILGTAAYMSPEQAKGKAVDKRADIWAFGVVLFEMLTGHRPFAGEEVSDVLASVLAREPQLATIPDTVPPIVRQVLKACLQKDPKKRIHDMADVRLAMNGTFETVRDAEAPIQSPQRSKWVIPAIAAALVVVGVLAAAAAWMFKPAEPRQIMRFAHRVNAASFTRQGRPVAAISRDGRRLAFVADNRVYLWNFDESDSRPIPGTDDENPSSPFFSPDGQWVGYWSSDNALKKIRLTGGTPVVLTKAGNPLGVSWGPDDKIVYALTDGIWRVSGNGGTAEHLVKTEKAERIHAPQMLPDGNTLLFASTSEAGAEGWDKAKLIALRLDRGERKILRTGAADPRYVSSGHIVYVFESTLFALPFDLNSLEVRGGPVPVVPEVRRAVGADIGIAQYAVSDNGTLVYVKGRANDQVSLALADRSGMVKPIPASNEGVFHPRFNRDDSRIVVYRADGTTSNIWIYEVAQSQWRQLTFNGGDRPLWTPDGRAITYRSGASLWQIPSDFSGAAAQLPGTDVAGNMGPFDWSSDGEVLLYGSPEGLHAFRPKATAAKADVKETLVMKPPEGATLITRASFSPDARWMVYTAVTTEGSLAYVSPFPAGVGGHRKIMNEAAAAPIWSRDGREIFVNTLGTLQVLGIKTQPAPDWTNPTKLFTMQGMVAPGAGSTNWDITRDGKQILIIVPKGAEIGASNQELQIVLNWNEELKRLVP
jgi:hypothetical protein